MKFCRFGPLIISVTTALVLTGCTKDSGARVTSYAAEPTVLTASNGMTLYVFDKDQGGESSCYKKCAVNWPPYIDTENEQKPGKWQLAQRTDGTAQWTYEGKPVYFFKGDVAEGDAKGDGKDGVWHIIYRS